MAPAQPDLLSPDATPSRSGVRRVNRVPIYLAAGAASLFMAVMGSVAWNRAARQQEQQAQQPPTSGTSSLSAAKAITGAYQGTVVPAAVPVVLPAPASAASPVLVARPTEQDLDRPPLPPGRNAANAPNAPQASAVDGGDAPSADPVADQIRQRRLQLAEQALQAPTTVKFSLQRTGDGGAPTSRGEMLARLSQVREQAAQAGSAGQDVNAAYQLRLAQLRAAAGGGSGGSVPAAAPSRTGMAQFNGQPNRWAHDAQVLAPESPYMLLAGGVIPAILQDGINSELPGQIRGQVSRNVYDTARGVHLLIPQGTQLVGAYSSDVGYGQSRVVVAWQRLVFPDGKTLDLGAMPGADPAGYAGFSDKVNRHLLRTFTSAFLMSGIVGGITYSQNRGQSQYGAPTAGSVLSEALGQQLGQVTAQMIAKNLNLSPTLEIRPGFRFNVVVTKDLKLPGPYQAFDYEGAQR